MFGTTVNICNESRRHASLDGSEIPHLLLISRTDDFPSAVLDDRRRRWPNVVCAFRLHQQRSFAGVLRGWLRCTDVRRCCLVLVQVVLIGFSAKERLMVQLRSIRLERTAPSTSSFGTQTMHVLCNWC